MPLLSIIIPKKYSSTLEESNILPSIESQLEVDFSEIEVVVCQSIIDGQTPLYLDLSSMPNLNKVTKQYAEECFMSTPANSRNIGLKHISGDFVVFWDYDDYIRYNSGLKEILDFIKAIPEKTQIVECSYCIDFGSYTSWCEINTEIGFFTSVWNYIFRRSFLEKNNLTFQSTYHSYEDNHFVWDALGVADFNRDIIESTKQTFYYHKDTASDPNAQYHSQNKNPQFITDLFRMSQDYYSDVTKRYYDKLWLGYLMAFCEKSKYLNRFTSKWEYERERNDLRYYLSEVDFNRNLIYPDILKHRNVFFDYSIILDRCLNFPQVLCYLNDQLKVDFERIEIIIPTDNFDVTKYTHIRNSIYFLNKEPTDIKILSDKVLYIKNTKAVNNVYYLSNSLEKFKFLNEVFPLDNNNWSVLCTPEYFNSQTGYINNMPIVESNKILSVVVPYHNEGYEVYTPLFTSLDNQIGINFDDIEVLICRGDGENIVPIMTTFPNVEKVTEFVITQGINGSPGFNRSLGLCNARGKYVAFLDIDDELVSNDILSKLFAEIETHNYPDVIDMPFISEISAEQQYYVDNKNPFQLWASVYRTEFIKENQIDFAPRYYGEDLTFVIEVAASNPIRHYFEQYFYKYKFRDNSAVTQRGVKYEKFISDTIQIYTDLLEWKKKNLSSKYQFDMRYILNIYPLLARELNLNLFSRIPMETQIKCIDILTEIIAKYKPFVNISSNLDGILDSQKTIETFISEVKL